MGRKGGDIVGFSLLVHCLGNTDNGALFLDTLFRRSSRGCCTYRLAEEADSTG